MSLKNVKDNIYLRILMPMRIKKSAKLRNEADWRIEKCFKIREGELRQPGRTFDCIISSEVIWHEEVLKTWKYY